MGFSVRTTLSALVALFAMATTDSLAGQSPGTGVNESRHDITYLGRSGILDYKQDDFQRVCVFCHTPHNAVPYGTVPAPLWNHVLSGSDVQIKLEPYKWAAPANTTIPISTADPLIGPTRLCLSCHDGVTAVDSHGSSGSANNGNHVMTASYTDALGNTVKLSIDDLTITHPIGFRYQDAVNARNRDGLIELVTADQTFLTSIPSNPNTKTRAGFTWGTLKIQDVFYDGYFTCSSCHDVHNTKNKYSVAAISGATANYLLLAPRQQSVICLSCHVK